MHDVWVKKAIFFGFDFEVFLFDFELNGWFAVVFCRNFRKLTRSIPEGDPKDTRRRPEGRLLKI
jgi:hypothetical protein